MSKWPISRTITVAYPQKTKTLQFLSKDWSSNSIRKKSTFKYFTEITKIKSITLHGVSWKCLIPCLFNVWKICVKMLFLLEDSGESMACRIISSVKWANSWKSSKSFKLLKWDKNLALCHGDSIQVKLPGLDAQSVLLSGISIIFAWKKANSRKKENSYKKSWNLTFCQNDN